MATTFDIGGAFGQVPYRDPIIPDIVRWGRAWNEAREAGNIDAISALAYCIVGLCWGGEPLPGVPMGMGRLCRADFDPLLYGDLVYDALLRKQHHEGAAIGAAALDLQGRVNSALPTVASLEDELGNSEALEEQPTASM